MPRPCFPSAAEQDAMLAKETALLAEANKTEVARLVREGSMPVAVLEHVLHLEANVLNLTCLYCQPRVDAIAQALESSGPAEETP